MSKCKNYCSTYYIIAVTDNDGSKKLEEGKKIYESRCIMCHGYDAHGDGPLAKKSIPPAPDITSCAYQKQLAKYPGIIVASIVLMPGGNLIPQTLKENNVKIPHKTWTDDDLRAINAYILSLVAKNLPCP